MRIGIITPAYPPTLNGVSTSCGILEKELIEHGHEVFIVTPAVKGYVYNKNVLALKSFKVPKFISPDLTYPFPTRGSILNFFKKNKVEILHSYDTFFSGPVGIHIAKRLGIPHVHTYSTLVEEYNYISIPGINFILRRLTKFICNNSDIVINPTSKIKEHLDSLKVTTPMKQLAFLDNSKNLTKLPYNKMLADSLGIQKDDFVFITFGRVAKEKSIDKNLEILAPLIHKYKNIKYIVAGIGNYFDELKKLSDKLNIASSVLFTGPYSQNDIPNLASISNAFLFSSTTETQGLVLAEAMKCGLLVIAINDPAFDYILLDGVNGFKRPFKELGSACEEIYLNRKLLSKLSLGALESAEKINGDQLIKEYISLYSAAIKATNIRK